jgi:drug/metabolite transporter (DMT)-like permease
MAAIAIAVSTLGVVLLSAKPGTDHGFSWKTWSVPGRGVVLGLASGACFALASVGYRGAMLHMAHPDPFLAGAYGLVWAQSIQVLLLGGWLLARDRGGLLKVVLAWRVSLLAGLMGTLASMGWFTAYAMRSAVDVRIVALVEVIYSYAVSRRLFKEKVSRAELIGMALVIAGLVAVSLGGR